MTTTTESGSPSSDLGTDDTTRAANREIVATYMACRGQDRLRRHLLFTEDGIGGLWTTETGEPIVITGRDRLGDHAVWSLQCFPDWAWTEVEIFDTQDPNRFWVECRGEGAIIFPGYERGHYVNHFIHSFQFENGLIKAQREFMNPCMQFRALGIDVPAIRREGIPT
ncbi:PhzA/PhzB family protein [Nocardia altamirensis]|uniref:PhzA/PhzB family protein n=1 Tax=Nocardia altamirensis TaxID=472158 RepID=UPI000A0358FC|nr:PhzA/PhzB family protein [Nocardia altamirensis]